MRIAGVDVDFHENGNVSKCFEFREIYDGWGAVLLKDGRVLNRWASEEDPKVAYPGFEEQFDAVERILGRA